MGQLLLQLQLQRLHVLKPYFSSSCMAMAPPFKFNPFFPKLPSRFQRFTGLNTTLRTQPNRFRFICKMNGSDMISQLELGKPEERRRPVKQVNGIFWILLLNIGIYVADHLLQLVEEEEGNFALWLSYILTGAGANLVSWLVLPSSAVSVGASGAVFGLFAISVLVKMSWDWRKILEVLILGQFVIERVMEAARASTSLPGSFRGGYALQSVNHLAHLSGALIGVALVWLLSRVPSHPPEQDVSALKKKKDLHN